MPDSFALRLAALRYPRGDVPKLCSGRLPGAGDMECAAFGSVLYR